MNPLVVNPQVVVCPKVVQTRWLLSVNLRMILYLKLVQAAEEMIAVVGTVAERQEAAHVEEHLTWRACQRWDFVRHCMVLTPLMEVR